MIRRIAIQIFTWYCHPDYRKDIIGDLEELYQANLTKFSKPKAQWIFLLDVVLLFRPSLIRSFGQNSI